MNGRIQRPTTDPRLTLPRVGKVKVGKKSDKGYPMSVDYFIPSGKYAGLFTQAYGERPQTLQVIFPSDEASEVCAEYYEYRDDKGALVAKGDGYAFEVWNGAKYVAMTTDDYPDIMQRVCSKFPNKLYQQTGDGWRVRLTLTFILPLVRGIAGVWVFETNGTASTIPQIRDTFDTILRERGQCKGVIFDLNVKFAQSQKPGEKSRYPVVSLVLNESEENVKRIIEAKKPVNLLADKK